MAAKCLYPGAIFRVKTSEKLLYLTFDDGPHPGSTFAILRILKDYNVKSVFFCSGSQAEMNPDLVSAIKAEGHIVGNHGHNHPDGWKTSFSEYISDISRADRVIGSPLFRPPYGRITRAQFQALKEKYRIIIWDLMPYDFDLSFGAGETLSVMKRKLRTGSIIVLHDTPGSKAIEVLSEFIDFAGNEGYSFSNEL